MTRTLQENLENMEPTINTEPIQRLCNEIQLFDLCDKNSCSSKSGRFCTDHYLLSRFEKIEELESRRPDPELSEEWEDELEDEFDEDSEHEDEFFDDEFYDDEE